MVTGVTAMRLRPVGIALVLLLPAAGCAAATASPAAGPSGAASPAAASAAPRRSVVSGTVRDAVTGAGLPGVEVMAVAVSDPDETESIATESDSRGRYVLDALDPGVEYRVRARPNEDSPYVEVYAPGTSRALAATRVTAPARLDIRVPRGQVVTGTLTDPAGRPTTGDLYLHGADDAHLQRYASADSQGRWRALVLPGRYLVVGRYPDPGVWFAPGVDRIGAAQVVDVRAGRATAPVRVRMPRPALVDVTVVDAVTRRPVAQTCVHAALAPEDPQVEGPGSTAPFRIPEINSGACPLRGGRGTVPVDPHSGLVEVTAPGHVPTLGRVRAARGTTVPLTVALPVAGAITGRLTDAAGSPSEACVEAEAVDAPATADPVAYDCAMDGGRLALLTLAPGRYRVRVGNVGGYALTRYAPDADSAATATVYTVTAGKTLDIGTVRLRVGGVVTGRVVDGRGRPVVGASVSVPGPRWWDGDVARAVTDARGRYRLVDLPRGRTRLRVDPPSRTGLGAQWLGGAGDETRSATVWVRLGRTVAAPDMVLRAGATLSVRLRGARDATVAVEAFDLRGRAVGLPVLMGRNGTAVLTGLPATGVRVHAWSSSLVRPAQGWFGGSSFADAKSVVLRAGRTTSVTLVVVARPPR